MLDLPPERGRLLTIEDLDRAPEKIELVRGEIPEAEDLLMLVLTQLGLRRVVQMVGAERFRAAMADDESQGPT
jgi:hypothetical protein